MCVDYVFVNESSSVLIIDEFERASERERERGRERERRKIFSFGFNDRAHLREKDKKNVKKT